MAKASDQSARALDADKTGLLTGLFAEENEFDRRALWRIGTWGVAAVGAVVLAVTSNQWSLGIKRDRLAAADMSRQAQQIQTLTKESQNETRRLANAVDTLNSDRDRLFARVTVIEQGLDSVTGTIAKQTAQASLNAAPKPPPSVAPPPATVMPPSVPAADSQPQAASQAPQSPSNQAALTPATTSAISPPAAVNKPRADAAKPDPAPGAIATLPQLAMIKPAVPLPPAVSPVPVSPVPASPAPASAPASAPALGGTNSMMGPPDPAAPKLVEVPKGANAAPAAPAPPSSQSAVGEIAAAAPAANSQDKDQEKAPTDAEAAKIQRTEFAVELGGANSISGLRALWRGLLKSNNAELAELKPIIVLREGNSGLGMQLRLAAGPLQNAAEAARICAALAESRRACDTTVFDGQRLAMGADEPSPAAAKPPVVKRYYPPKHTKKDDTTPPKQEATSTLSSWFGSSKH